MWFSHALVAYGFGVLPPQAQARPWRFFFVYPRRSGGAMAIGWGGPCLPVET